MKKKKNIIIIITIILLLLILVAILLYKENIFLNNENANNSNNQLSTGYIGTSILENGVLLSSENEGGTLFTNLLINDEQIKLGKKYEEKLCVKNTGNISNYVRVIINKSWSDIGGNKDTEKTVDFIELGLASEEDGWLLDEASTTSERIILVYKYAIEPDKTTSNFLNYIKINSEVQTKTNITESTTENGYKTINLTKTYDDYSLNFGVEIGAVQSSNAQDAIKYEWGMDVTINEKGEIVSID